MSNKTCKIKLCGCAGKAKQLLTGTHNESYIYFLSGTVDGVLPILETIAPDQEPEFVKLVDDIVRCAEGKASGPINKSITALMEFGMKIAT